MYVSPTLKSATGGRRGVSPAANRSVERRTQKHKTEDPSQTLQPPEKEGKHGTLLRSKLSRPKREQSLDSVLGRLSSDLLVTSVERLSLSSVGTSPLCRTTDERTAVTPDRANLERRGLKYCPALEGGGERLRLLNLQHNSITRLEGLSHLARLVFLDLYDNLIADISGLDELVSLRVLMLGKNRIRKISGLERLVHLDVLDLHGNLIREVENLSHLCHLRVLNLAGNELVSADHFEGLEELVELNLRRNRVSRVCGLEVLPHLQRLFLSYNLIRRWEDIACLSDCSALGDLALDGNPLSTAVGYRSDLLGHLQQLSVLDQIAITEEEWMCAASSQQCTGRYGAGRSDGLKEYKERVIRGIRNLWNSSHYNDSDTYELPTHLVDHDVERQSLALYGTEALEALECACGPYRNVTRLQVCCVGIEDAMLYLSKVSTTLPNMANLVLESNGMMGFEHVNALAGLGVEHLVSLTISPIGNAVTEHPHFLHYCIYRLKHLGLREVNGRRITTEDESTSMELFRSLGHLISSLPPMRYDIAGHTHRTTPDMLTMALKHPQTPSITEDNQRVAALFSAQVLSSSLAAHTKAEEVLKLWPSILAELVHKTIEEYRSIDEQMAALLDKL